MVDAYFNELKSFHDLLQLRLERQQSLESESAEFNSLLKEVDEEIDSGNAIPADLKSRLAAVEFPVDKGLCELVGKQLISKSPELQALYMQDSESLIAYVSALVAKMLLKPLDPVPFAEKVKVACEKQAIPNRDVVDKLIRYEAAAERSLSRALDRNDSSADAKGTSASRNGTDMRRVPAFVRLGTTLKRDATSHS